MLLVLQGGTQLSRSDVLHYVQVSYDASGRQDCVATRMNPSAFASPPASACTLGTAGAFGPDRITKYALAAFAATASIQVRARAWRMIWDRWNEWDFGEREALMDVHRSTLDLGVIGYGLEVLTPDQLEAELSDMQRSIQDAFARWWTSSVDLTSEINRLQSRLQPLAHSRELKANGALLSRAQVMYQFSDPELAWRLSRLRHV
ncbi:MAG: hypothetical protein ACK4S3_07245 [Parvibaculum sp.]